MKKYLILSFLILTFVVNVNSQEKGPKFYIMSDGGICRGYLLSGEVTSFHYYTHGVGRDMEFDDNGTLYTIREDIFEVKQNKVTMKHKLGTIVPQTDNKQSKEKWIEGIPSQNDHVFNTGMSFNTVNKTMYVIANKMLYDDFSNTRSFDKTNLYTLDLKTGKASLIGHGTEELVDIAFNSSGQCYGISKDDELVGVDLLTGIHTVVGSLALEPKFYACSICFDRPSNKLYLFATYLENGYGYKQLRTIDITSGLSTLIKSDLPFCGYYAAPLGFAMPFND